MCVRVRFAFGSERNPKQLHANQNPATSSACSAHSGVLYLSVCVELLLHTMAKKQTDRQRETVSGQVGWRMR